MRLLVIAMCAVTFGATACKSRSNEEAKPTAATQAEPATVPETTAMPAPGTTASGINISGLGDQLKKEATHRPASGVTSEQLFDALDKAGLKTTDRKQVLGMTVNASYCANSRVDKLTVVVCEYPDVAVAQSSTKIIEKRFAAAAPTFTRSIHGPTVLTVIHGGNTSSVVDRIISTFTAL